RLHDRGYRLARHALRPLLSRAILAMLMPSWPIPAASHHRLVAFDADTQDLVGIALPPVVGGEDFDLAVAAIAGRLHHGGDGAQVDHAAAHHAAVEQEVGGGHQPVVDVVGENFFSGARDLALEIGVPPDVIGVDRDAGAVAQFVAEVVRLRERVHAGA